jgi:hypothetical protein
MLKYSEYLAESTWEKMNSKELVALAIGSLKRAASVSRNRLSDLARIDERVANVVRQLENIQKDI